MEFKEGARVYLADGKEIGKLSRVVLDPRTAQVTDIVIQHGLLDREERVAAATLIDYASEDEIHMKEIANGWDELQPFEETSFQPMNVQDGLVNGMNDQLNTPTVYAYPPTVPVSGGVYPPGSLTTGIDAVGPTNADQYRKQTIRNIPEEAVTVNEGARVVSHDGAELGKVERIFTYPETGKISHFLISRGLLLKERKLLPYDWIDVVSDDQILLGVNARFVEHLPDYQEK